MNPLTLLYSVTALAAGPSVPVHVPARPANVDSVPAAPVPADSVPADSVLTVDGVTRMTTFWKSLSDEDKRFIKQTKTTVRVPRCGVLGTLFDVGIAALADSNPKVLAALQHAGLSGQKYQLYQHLIGSAFLTQIDMIKANQWSIGDRLTCHVTQVERMNIDFLNAHRPELIALAPGLFTEPPFYSWYLKSLQRDL
jgi:hypothetical protein